MKSRISIVLASLVIVVVTLFAPTPVAADGALGPPVATPAGTFGGIAYVEYNGIFEGQTSTGTYRVPYRITAPADPSRGNQTVLVEPSHYFGGLGALEVWLGQDFLFTRGFIHGGIGWSTATPDGGDLRILDPAVPGVFINGGFVDDNGRTDDEIIADFGRALAVDPGIRPLLGPIERRYLTGFSDSSDPLLRLVTAGRATGAFELVIPFTADRGVPSTAGIDPQAAVAAGAYSGKLMIVNSEAETFAGLVDRGVAPSQYRYYAAAGTPHVSDPLIPSFANETTPASNQFALHAHFLQGDDWVKGGKQPPPSTHLKTTDGVTLDRDGNGNAIAVSAKDQGNGKERSVPRLPFIELGEARYVTGFLGFYDNVKAIGDLGFTSYDKYLKAFEKAVADYVKAGYMLDEDANVMRRRAALCPELTYTEIYRDHYDDFIAITPCN